MALRHASAGGATRQPSAPVITVAIVNYNTTDLLAACLGALERAGGLPVEVIVVDNASTDGGTARIVAEHPSVRLIANAENRFYPAAANQAWRAGSGEVVLFLGTDVLIRSATVETMRDVLMHGAEYGATTCRLVRSDGEAEAGARAELTPLVYFYNFTPAGRLFPGRRDRLNARQEYRDWDRRSSRDVGSCSGSCLMVRRSVLERFGGYDERFKLYFLEDDLCLKIRCAGMRIRFIGEQENLHSRHASVKRESSSRIRGIWHEDALLYARLHFGSVVAGSIAGAMTLTETARSLQRLLSAFGMAPRTQEWWREDGGAKHRERP